MVRMRIRKPLTIFSLTRQLVRLAHVHTDTNTYAAAVSEE